MSVTQGRELFFSGKSPDLDQLDLGSNSHVNLGRTFNFVKLSRDSCLFLLMGTIIHLHEVELKRSCFCKMLAHGRSQGWLLFSFPLFFSLLRNHWWKEVI